MTDAAFVTDLFAGVGGVSAKPMFGGLGVYADGVMFALVTGEGGIFVKADDALKAELSAQGSSPFIWTATKGPNAGRPMAMGYWSLPESALDDPEEASAIGRKARAVAEAAKAAKAKRKPKKAKTRAS